MKPINKSCGGTFVRDADGTLLEHRPPTRPADAAPVTPPPPPAVKAATAAPATTPSTLFRRGEKRRSHPQE